MRRSASVVAPYSGLSIDASATNFPSCKAFFKAEETSGTTITESIYSQSVATTSLSFLTNRVRATFATGSVAISQAWPALSTTKSCIILFSGQVSTGVPAYIVIGNDNDGQGQVTLNQSVDNLHLCNVIPDGGAATEINTAPSTFTGGDDHIIYLVVDRDANLLRLETITNGATIQTVTPVDISLVGAITPETYIKVGGEFYGVAYFSFENGVPVDYQSACRWMGAEWAAGRKRLYPGWYLKD